jgi:hypothetical protein
MRWELAGAGTGGGNMGGHSILAPQVGASGDTAAQAVSQCQGYNFCFGGLGGIGVLRVVGQWEWSRL